MSAQQMNGLLDKVIADSLTEEDCLALMAELRIIARDRERAATERMAALALRIALKERCAKERRYLHP